MNVGYYFPDVHYLHGSRSLYTSSTNGLATTLTIPYESTYKLLIEYRFKGSGVTRLQLFMNLEGKFNMLNAPNFPELQPSTCNSMCYSVFSSSGLSEFTLKKGVYQVQVKSSMALAALKLVSFVVSKN